MSDLNVISFLKLKKSNFSEIKKLDHAMVL